MKIGGSFSKIWCCSLLQQDYGGYWDGFIIYLFMIVKNPSQLSTPINGNSHSDPRSDLY